MREEGHGKGRPHGMMDPEAFGPHGGFGEPFDYENMENMENMENIEF